MNGAPPPPAPPRRDEQRSGRYQPLPAGQGLPAGRTRQPSPAVDKRRALGKPQAVLRSQGITAARQKDKFVSLGVPGEEDAAADSSGPAVIAVPLLPEGELTPQPLQPALAPPPAIFEDITEPVAKGRIAVITVAESFDRQSLEELLRAKFPRLQVKGYQEVLHATPSLGESSGDAFFMNYGCVVFWGISTADEQALMHTVVRPCSVGPLDVREVEIDSFSYNYSSHEPPHVQNDVITLNKRFALDHQVKLAISHALAQSTKLAVYEERLQQIVHSTAHLPEMLATTGKVGITSKQIARLIGQVFLQRSAVNLLSSVLDTPEYFWSAPDHLQVLYKRVCEYLEIETRVEVLNTRFVVLQEFLDLLREHQNNKHMVRLEWIVIWLIVVEVIVGLVEVAGLVGAV